MSVNGFKIDNQTVKYNYEQLDNIPDANYTAPVFDSRCAYREGTYVTYNGVLYRFNCDHAAGTAWSGNDVTAIPLGDELIRAFSSLPEDLLPLINQNTIDLALINGTRTVNGITFQHYGPSGVRNGQYTIRAGTATAQANYNIISIPVSNNSVLKPGHRYNVYMELVDGSVEDYEKVEICGYARSGSSIVATYGNKHGDVTSMQFAASGVDNLLMRLQIRSGITISNDVTIRIRIFEGMDGILSGFAKQHDVSFPFTDLDDVTPGVWFVPSDASIANIPYFGSETNSGYVLIHLRSTTTVTQIAFPYAAPSLSSPSVYFRSWGITSTSEQRIWNSIGFGGHFIATETDLNNLLSPGVYGLSDSSTYYNIPSGSLNTSGLLLNYRMGSFIYQVFIRWAGGALYTRTGNASNKNFTVWKELAGGSSTPEYTFNNYNNTYNVTASPSITADSNNYLAATNNTADRTADIVSMLSQTGICNLGPGTYYVHNLEMPANTTLRGSGQATKVVLSGTDDGYAIKMNDYCNVEDMQIIGNLDGITISSTVGNRHGILWQGNYTENPVNADQPECGMISNVRIRGFSGGGITCYDTGYGTHTHIMVTNVFVRNCNAGINISYWSEFNKFTNVRTYNCYYGCINNGGNNIFVNCDFSTCKLAFLMDNENNQSPNNAHGSAIGCVFNHSDNNTGVGIKILNCAPGFIFDGCQIFYSQIDLENASGVVFSNCNCGSNNCNITIDGGGAVLFIGNMYSAAPVITITNNTNVHFVNCYVKDTGAVVA